MLILVDGDAFFTSVEQSVKPWLKGRPVVCGKERNIVATASYEARAYGVKLGVPLWDAKKMCPGLVVLPTDYETVSLFSKRMQDIIRRYTPAIEEYSIDEAFADLAGLRRYHRASYETIAKSIQQDIHQELDITVTVGLAPTKTLCKVAVGKGKPAGFTTIRKRDIDTALQNVPIEDIWNIGPATAALLQKHGIRTALQLKQKPEQYVRELLTKPGVETWQELNGIPAITLGEEKTSYQSIGKTKTFTPPSRNKEFVFAQLMKNIENACIKARRYHQGTRRITIYLRTQEFRGRGAEGRFSRVTAYPSELAPLVRKMFEEIWQEDEYRATGVFLSHLEPLSPIQPTLFEKPLTLVKLSRLYGAIDQLREQFGKHSVHLASTLPAQKTQHLSARGDVPRRKETLLKGETPRQRLPLPMLQVRVR